MRRGTTRKLSKFGAAPRNRLKEESRQEESSAPEDDLISEAAQGLKGFDDIPRLSEKDLDQDIERILTPSNPQASQNIAYFSYKDRQFKRDDLVDQMIIHFAQDGFFLLKDTNEAHDQEEFIDSKNLEAETQIKASSVDIGTVQLTPEALLKSLRNQFNYAERTAQSFSIPIKERGISTEPPPTRSFSGTVTQWDIYDNFMAELDKKRQTEHAEKEKEKEKETKKTSKKRERREDPMYSNEMSYALKIMERMVNQNDLQNTYHIYKYFDGNADNHRTSEGSLSDLWIFGSEKTKKKEVTSLVWNPRYHDMFAVGYGSYSFMKKSTGLICCYSLKNTRYPEYFFTTQHGVMCLDWHPQHPALLAVGLYDGTVLVFDVRAKHKKPIYQSTVRTNKHTDPVWQVKWQDDDMMKNLSFFSISSDGRVTNWVLMKSKLEAEEVIKLKLVSGQREGEEDMETTLSGLAGGTCFDFNPFFEHLFIVGTEEGKIHKCNKAYSGQYLDTYDGHFMAVYSVKWNKFHPKIFLSASADWTVKMWDHTIKAPLLTFDLGIAVGDVAWAPYSSTLFAAITADSKCHIYDLAQERLSEICDKRVKNGKCNHIAFNPSQFIILVGTDRGTVYSFKLSPNLRKTEQLSQEDIAAGVTQRTKEVKKLEEIMEAIDRTVY
ncbi:unnamed protein product [Blepharisma stoltei]|uniref:Dynein intermediate chain 1, axonemal n=1 Tax=Blepharisma stoltei TaxID=1481888 RepID=A0AAU9K2L4_9CILI|nr:unnamed protein product [Blepharisma stoltei]